MVSAVVTNVKTGGGISKQGRDAGVELLVTQYRCIDNL